MNARTHWSIYLPGLLAAILWGGLLFWSRARPDAETVFALSLFVLLLAVPALLLWTFLKARGRGVEVKGDNVEIRTGAPRQRRAVFGADAIEDITVRASALQKMLGAGSLVVTVRGKRVWRLDDMAAPEKIKQALEAARREKA